MAEQRASAEIIDLTSVRDTLSSSSSALNKIVSASALTADDKTTSNRTSLDDLYGDVSYGSDLVQAARRILLDCERRISAAIAASRSGNNLEADLESSRAFAIWPELFLCRSVSDGLGAAVLGIHYAYLNSVEALFSSDQLSRLADSIAFLAENPFLTFDRALDLLDELEDAGLRVDPPESSALGEILASEQ